MSLNVVINGVKFKEINQPWFVVYGEKDKFPFLHSALHNDDDNFPAFNANRFSRREYKCININGKFYAPTFNTKEL